MEIALVLSREHPSLPRAELEAVLQTEGVTYQIVKDENGLIVLEIPDKFMKAIPEVAQRLSFTHEIFQVLIKTPETQLATGAKKYPWNNVITSNYAVRVKKMDGYSNINTTVLEREIGGIIKEKVDEGVGVRLENPSIFVRIVLLNKMALIGNRIVKISKKHFFELKPHKRPFFYPGSMSPKLARCMVNLTHIKKGETLLDPFCGTGGILIEAGIIGSRVIGTDIDYKMVKGTIENLQHCGISDYHVFCEDARKLELPDKVDAIVTDPPYGISASTRGAKSHELYNQSMKSLEKLLKDDGLICLATPHYLDLNEVLEGTSFQIVKQHHIRMHKSLTRVISILEKTK